MAMRIGAARLDCDAFLLIPTLVSLRAVQPLSVLIALAIKTIAHSDADSGVRLLGAAGDQEDFCRIIALAEIGSDNLRRPLPIR
jgi:hypothetical protein